ncbi:MAG: hypothetical protein HWE30_19215 [Methylocystaceae bacterium]|nr:hypothetical protein [Methylocystaceae bacterium]
MSPLLQQISNRSLVLAQITGGLASMAISGQTTGAQTGLTAAKENSLKVITLIGKAAWKIGKKLIKKGKVTADDIKEMGADEILGMIDDVFAIISLALGVDKSDFKAAADFAKSFKKFEDKLPDGYTVIKGVGADVPLDNLPTGFKKVVNKKTGEVKIASSDGKVYNSIEDVPTGNRPANLSPLGAGRSGAFKQAKRDMGIPVSQQPNRVLPNIDKRGNVQPGKIYEYDIIDPNAVGGKRTVKIRDDAEGHLSLDDPSQNRGPHFNTPDGGHYDY